MKFFTRSKSTRSLLPSQLINALVLALAVISAAAAASEDEAASADEDIGGWWQSWDSLLFVSVQDNQAQLFAAGILNPSLVKGELISWSSENPLLDIENPEPGLQSRELLGLEISENLRKQGKLWRGRIYDPRSGSWYKSHVSVVDDELNIRGYIGMPMLGQTRVFERYNPCKRYGDKVMVIWSGSSPPSCESTSEQ
ncbi:DUF2147 domain-containing protein [Pseudomonadales bacterium]|nr:DUF2147 domain-containing protein [Pseudomonadales bacterium]